MIPGSFTTWIGNIGNESKLNIRRYFMVLGLVMGLGQKEPDHSYFGRFCKRCILQR